MQEPNFDRARLTNDLSLLARKLGIRCRRVDVDLAEYELGYDESNTTVGDFVHGGALLTLADCAATGAAWSNIEQPERYRGLTVDLSLAFLASARSVDLVATATVSRRGSTLCFCTVDIRTVQKAPIARGQVVYKLERKREPSEVMAGLFEGRSTVEQMRILTELERDGARLYRAWAEAERNEDQKQKLLDASDREYANAKILSNIAGGQPA